MVDAGVREVLLTAQRNEITEHHIYKRLAQIMRDEHNSQVLRQIADDELDHYRFWQQYTHGEAEPDRWKVARYVFIARVLGLTFSIKLMERSEERAQDVYAEVAGRLPSAERIVHDEDRHEHELIGMLDEERLRYIGSMVLGLNDALVELTGALAGLTLALQNARVIGMAGLITGIAASLSMAASEYLSTKSEGGRQDPLKASLYTGVAYVFTVILLIAPFFIFDHFLAAIALTLINALIIILVFTFYISVARDLDFRHRFLEMAAISFGVAALSFGIGFAVREVLGIEI
ncbi:MAG: VIT1/CCC1 transporter family protein [Chloroflexi bacterium]|nr:VIT1/CCC1 transporter family protein [Chloroflexota bacterium]